MNWLKNLKIQSKLFLAFAFFILLIFAFVLFTTRQFINSGDSYNNAVKRQVNISEAILTLTTLRSSSISTSFAYYGDELSQAIAGLRNIDYEALCASFIEIIESNRESVFADISLSMEERQWRSRAYDRIGFIFSEHFYPSFFLIRDGINTQNPELIQRGLANAYESGTELLSLLNGLYETASDTALAMTGKLTAYSRGIIYSLVVAAVIIILVSILTALYMAKIITSPIADIGKAMAEISGGNLNFPIRSGYKDELGALSNRIGDMVDTILEKNKAVAAIDYLDSMIYATDLDYNLIYINRSLADMYHIDCNTYRMKKCYRTLRGKDYPCEICQLPAILKDKESFPSFAYRDIWDEVLGKWIYGKASIIRWTDGSMAHYQTINDDTHKKNDDDLQKAARDAEAASISKTAFLANMSHEIRTPMNSIIGFSELALDDEIPDKTRDYLNKIMVNSEWLLQIINDILDISKIESGKMELEKIPFDLHELFSACRTIITPKADEKGVDMRFYAEPSIGKKMLGDPVRLRQVLLNMLSNSVKFTNTGGVIKLSATISEKSANGITVLFKVTDSGIGMTPEQIAKIAQPFVQAEAGTTRKYGGTGLGLAISKNLVKLMGGNLNIESTLGIGSKFSFEITFDTKDILAGIYDEETIISDIIEKPDLDGEVLVCEDNNMNQQMICSHLERVGLRPTIVENGLAGLEMVLRRLNKDEKPFDLIFMDIFMPVMDGIEAATKISQLGTGTPIVALTANVMASDKELYLKSGMNDCVGKPFVSQELWRCLLKYLKPVELKSEIVDEDKLADEKLLTMMKINFVTDHQSTYKKITSAIAEGDIKLAHRIAHSLKGNAGMLGKAVLQKASADVENLLKDERNLVTPKAMSTLETELRAVLDELALSLNAVFSGKPAQPVAAPSLDQEKKRDLLAALRPLLESGNPGCLKHINSLRSISGTEKLIQQMENLDFEQATETLAELEVE